MTAELFVLVLDFSYRGAFKKDVDFYCLHERLNSTTVFVISNIHNSIEPEERFQQR